MIIDLKRFIAAERPFWDELADLIRRREEDPYRRMDYTQINRLYYLYQRASADLAKISTFSAERAIRGYLENLVGRAYSFIHSGHEKAVRFSPLKWFWNTFPGTFRRRWMAFVFSLAIFLVGSLFGAGAITVDPDAKAVLMPFEHLQMDPAERV
ncbi:MAG: stage II sporulation protein M, partial [Desulfosarcinaceae bacterium]